MPRSVLRAVGLLLVLVVAVAGGCAGQDGAKARPPILFDVIHYVPKQVIHYFMRCFSS